MNAAPGGVLAALGGLQMSRAVRRAVVLCAVVGLVASMSSLYVHYQLQVEPAHQSFCDVSAAVSCAAVYQSSYAAVRGVPVALLGTLWFTAVLLLAAGSRWGPPGLRESSAAYLFAWAVMGAGVSLWLAYASFVILQTVCLMCLTTDVAVVGILVLSGRATPWKRHSRPRRVLGGLKDALASPAACALLALFVVMGATAMAVYPRAGAAAVGSDVPRVGDAAVDARSRASLAATDPQQSEFVRFWESLPRVDIPIPAEGAAVLLVKFTDHQCPSCAQTHALYAPLVKRYAQQYPGAVRYVVKHYPLESECNPAVPRPMHPASCEAAVAVRLARETGRESQLEDWLYANWAVLTPTWVRRAAREVGHVANYDSRYQAVLDQVKTDVALARILDIRGTPTFFLNGVRFSRPIPVDYLELAIQHELRRAGRTGVEAPPSGGG